MARAEQGMRAQASAMRREADRLAMLRLRLSAAFVELSGSEDGDTAALGDRMHGHWTAEEYIALGRISSRLRAMARSLEESAVAEERVQGRRMGGYGGAGFLGRGDQARQRVDEVREFVGSHHGAEIGWGESLAPLGESGAPVMPSAHPSEALGEITPVYAEGADTPAYQESADTADEDTQG